MYTAPNGDVRASVLVRDETLWLTQKQLSKLFNVGISTINHHLKEVISSGELDEKATIRKNRIVQKVHEVVKYSGHVIGDLIKRPWGLWDFRVEDPFGYYLRITERHNILDPGYAN